MRRMVLLSFFVHLIVFGGVVFYTGWRGQKPVVQRVYTVRMVHLPATDPFPHAGSPPAPVTPSVEKEKRPSPARPKPPTPEGKTVKKESPSPTSSGAPKNVNHAGLRLDVASFPFPDYLYALKDRIEKNWHIPYTGTFSGSERTTVFFQILRNGRIAKAFVEARSGVVAFDQAALDAVLRSVPFPPLPEKFPDDYLGVHFVFEYEE